MTKKDIRKVEEVVEKVLHEMLEEQYEERHVIVDEDEGADEAVIPMSLIDEMEEYMGESITFMGIS